MHAAQRRIVSFQPVAVLALGLALLACRPSVAAEAWYKGQTHCHSFWSDGDQFPEMVIDWYKTHGYAFMALSDHRVLMQGERFKDVHDKKRPIPEAVIEACRKRFGPDWVQTRGEGQKRQVRLKTFDEISRQLEEPGKFIMIPNEEIDVKFGLSNVHINAINVGEVLKAVEGTSVADTIERNFLLIDQQAKRLHRPIVGTLNHPSWVHFDIRPEDLIDAPAATTFEVCNAAPGVNYFGDELFPDMERFWDIVNAVRIAEKKLPPLFGIAADDAHRHLVFDDTGANPGRGWIVVRSEELSPNAITEAIGRGDFYASTGVVLDDVQFDAAQGKLCIEIKALPGAKYTTKFFGTRTGFDRATKEVPVPDFKGKAQRLLKKYSDQIGQVLATVEGAAPVYTFQGDELYVRAVVYSDQPAAHPGKNHVQTGMAWCQPVGWKKWLKK